MKNAISFLSLLLLLGVFGQAQQVSPDSVNFGDVLIGQTSPQVNVSFTNTGDAELDLTVSITGPFAIPINRCGRGVKVGTHCNVDITYTPEAAETDTGTLTFNYGGGSVSVSLTGTGVTTISYATKTKLKGPHGTFDIGAGLDLTFTATVTSKGGAIPDGGIVDFYCTGSVAGTYGPLPGTTKGGVATAYLEVDQIGSWQCWAIYTGGQQGDVQFESSTSNYDTFHTIDPCCAIRNEQ